MIPTDPRLARINVVGTSGSGKTTFARQLAARLGFPHIEMDQVYWEPDWTEPSDDRFFARLEAALDRPNWIVCGNYNRTLPIKWQNVTMVVWIDYSFPRVMAQALKRAIRRILTQEEFWPGTGN